MRVLGALLFVLGGAAVAHCVRGAFAGRRPRDLLYAVAAPIALVGAVVGLVLVFVPGFFG